MRALGLALLILVVNAPAHGQATGTVSGEVRVSGAAGRPVPLIDPVVVFIEDVARPFSPPQPLAIRQHNKQFHPRFLLAPQGAVVSFPNDDGVDHNVFSISPVSTFDLGYYGAGVARTVRFENPGAVRVYCNIHPEMIADVLVLANPYYARVGAGGRFTIERVPAGRHTVRAWFPYGPSASRSLDVPPAGVVAATFQLQSTVVTGAHDNKHGEPYFLDYQR